uniref:Uncharacterized protein n=1 Tax=Cannabis sativa TaxID=3483 RepID=A0A803R9I3_CANSA
MKNKLSKDVRIRENKHRAILQGSPPKIWGYVLGELPLRSSVTIHYNDQQLHQVSKLQDTLIGW